MGSFMPGPSKVDDESSDEEVVPQHTTPSPKPIVKTTPNKKLSMKQRKAKLEENIRNQNKNLKELAKERSEARRIARTCDKTKEKKKPEDPFSAFMKEFRERMDRVDANQEIMNEKIDNVGTRIDKIESHVRKQDKANKKEFDNLKQEITNNYTKLEEVVTNNVKNTFQPRIEALEKGVKGDLKNLINDQVNEILDARLNNNLQNKGACSLQHASPERTTPTTNHMSKTEDKKSKNQKKVKK